MRNSKIEGLISQFELENAVNIPAKFLSGGQKKN
jgi:ABC-type multidrug transport system ATPase subunit